jgi:hypothetical protein
MKELIDLLVSNLKVNESQARGGTAVLLKAARDKLGADEFRHMLGGVAGIDDLMQQAPASSGMGKLFGGFASALGGDKGALLANIVTGFGRLGLTPDHARSFAPVILEFLRTRVGNQTTEKLEKALRAGF